MEKASPTRKESEGGLCAAKSPRVLRADKRRKAPQSEPNTHKKTYGGYGRGAPKGAERAKRADGEADAPQKPPKGAMRGKNPNLPYT